MKRLLAALAALLISAQAWGSVLVVDCAGNSGVAADDIRTGQHALRGTLTRHNSTFDVADARYLRALHLQNGQLAVGWASGSGTASALQTYDALVLENYKVGAYASLDSLFLATRRFPNVPMVVLPPNSIGVNTLVQTAACSTGVNGNGANFGWIGFYVNSRPTGGYVAYSTKSMLQYRTSYAPPFLTTAADRTSGGIWRVLLGLSQATNYWSPNNAVANPPCTFCDKPAVRSTMPDTALVLMRQAVGNPKRAIIIVSGLGEASSYCDPVPLQVALAMADSLTGGKVFGKAARIGVHVQGYFSTTAVDFGPLLSGSGITCFSGVCDTLNQQATMDSLAALGVKLSISVATDSAEALSYQRRILSRLNPSYVRFTPTNYSGFSSTVTNARGNQIGSNTGYHRLQDPFGKFRARTFIPKDSVGLTARTGSLPRNCTRSGTDADTCTFCLLRTGFDRSDSLYLAIYGSSGGVDHIVQAPSYAWVPSRITKTSAASLDSLYWYCYQAGVRGFYVNSQNDEQSLHLYTGGGGGPFGASYNNEVIPVYQNPDKTGPRIGGIRLLSGTGAGFKANDPPTGHDDLLQTVFGWLCGPPWYAAHYQLPGSAPGLLYTHDFYVGVSVLQVSAGMLGGVGDGTNPWRHGWWQIKGLKNIVDITNDYAGRPVNEIVFPEELAP